MSATTDRATRRDLRRAVGVEAVDVIESQGAALTRLQIEHGIIRGHLEQQRHALANLQHDIERAQRHQARQSASFMARLRWLLTGR